MSKTAQIHFSDAAIRRHFSNRSITELRDPRYPLRMRPHLSRETGSWHMVQYREGKAHWRKLGNWPALSSAALMKCMPDLLAEVATNPDARVIVPELERLGAVFRWFRDRSQSDRNLSPKRKANISSMVNRHLLPNLGDVALAEVSRSLIDERLVWPLQESYAPATVRQVLALAKACTRAAHRLEKIDRDPLAGMMFRDFVSAPIRPKDASLRPSDVRKVLRNLLLEDPDETLFVLLMMMHGTRIGETRLARIEHFDTVSGWWYIPSRDTKTRTGHRLPLTPIAKKLIIAWKKRHRHKYGGYLLLGTRPRRPIREKTAFEIIQHISQREWTSHDLRKVARTAWADLGIDFMTGEQLLNHSLPGISKTYIHTFAEHQSRDALERYHDWLMNQGLKKIIQRLDE